MAKPAKIEDEAQDPVGPAVVTPLHATRHATDDRGREIIGKVAWRKWTPLEAFFEKRRVKAGGKLPAEDIPRYNAGDRYTKLWDTAQSSGKDSTQSLNVSRGGGSGLPLSQAQHDAIRGLVAVESHLGARDRIIIRSVCGSGNFPSEAVALVSTSYAKSTTPRFLEALDSLVEAFGLVHKAPGRVSMEVKS